MTDSPRSEQIITAQRIIPMSGREPEAILCRGEWIVGSGDLAAMREAHPHAEIVEFPAATIVPGFNDAHQHPTIRAEQAMQIDLSPERITGLADLQAVLRERTTRTPNGQWILGYGYDFQRSNGGRQLQRDDIDCVSPDNPVLIVSVTLHSGTLNTRGLELAQLHTAADTPSGGELGVDASGHLTGVVVDQALYDLAFPAFTRRPTVVPPPLPSDLEGNLKAYFTELHAVGITSVGDALVGPASWDLLSSIDARGELTARVNALGAYDHLDFFRAVETFNVSPTARLRLGGIKAFADGAVNGGTCLVDTPVCGETGHGMERVSAAQLIDIVREVHDLGQRACVHANGDRAIRYVLDAIENVQEINPRPDARHRIEHTSIVTSVIVKRMHELGVVAVPFAAYARAHGDKLRKFYEPDRIEWMFAHRALLNGQVVVAGSSDYPCGPYEPLLAMESCVTRTDATGRVFGGSQRITAGEALALYTTGSAYASGEEATKGKLIPGYLADFVVLESDPLSVSPDHLSEINVLETWIGARPVWTRQIP